MQRVVVIGAAGRMGRRLVVNVLSAGMKLAGAIEIPESPFIGKDAAATAGINACGVNISSDLSEALKNADSVIDFSTGNVIGNAKLAAAAGASIVIGTTGLNEAQKNELKALSAAGARIVFASNFSVGVNLLFYLSRKATEILGENYDIEIVEMHHNQKKDSPSGTAVRLAEVITEARKLSYEKDVVHGREGLVGPRTKNEIGMHAVRGGDVVGDHTVMFATEGERVELTHKASSRDTFAKGAVRAVSFLANAKPGLYDMQDVLNLK